MNNLAEIQAFKIEDKSLDEILIYLCKWGKPRLSKTNNGWYCIIEVFITSIGCEFQVKSELNHKTPNDAVMQTYKRLIKAIEDLTS